MPYSYNYNEWQQWDRFDGPLEAPPFEDFQTSSEIQAVGLSSLRKRPIPSGFNQNSWPSDASPSFNEGSSFPSSAWTPNGTSLDFYSIPGSSSQSQNGLPLPFAPPTHNDYAFLANIDPTLLAADLANVTANHSIPIVSKPLGHSSPRKRPRANEEPEGSNQTSIDVFSDSKRRKLSTHGRPNLHSVHPPTTNNNNNTISDTHNNLYQPAPLASTSHLDPNAQLSSQTHYPNPQIFNNRPAPFVTPAPTIVTPSNLAVAAATRTHTSPGVSYISSSNANPPPFVPLSQDDFTSDNISVINNSRTPMPKTVGHGSFPSRKRPRTNEDPGGPNNTSINAFSYLKRRRLSTDGHQSLHIVSGDSPSTNNNITSSFNNDFSLPASIPRANTSLSSTPYPKSQIFHDGPAYSIPIPPAPPVLLPPVHMGATQLSATAPYKTAIDNALWWNPNADLYAPLVDLSPALPITVPPAYSSASGTPFYSSAYPGNEGTVDYTLNSNGNRYLYNAAGASQVDAFPSPYYTFPDAENGDWTTGLLDPEYLYKTTAVASPVASSSVVVPPFHTNTIANNAIQSSVVDSRQHSVPTTQISTTGNVANATIPDVQVPSTSGAPSADPLVITYNIIEPTTPPSPPSPTCSPKRKEAKKREPAVYPDAKLWSRNGTQYICHYKGPHCPEGCEQVLKSASIRNVTRHIRSKHAKGEAGMPDLSADERVAYNGLFPQGLLRVEARCTLPSDELHKCPFYRQHGRRWVVMTMERQDNLERKHEACHDP